MASNKSSFQSFIDAQASDPVSAFGGVVACNFKISKKVALEINKTFFEVILAKGYEKNALKILKKKKNMRVIDISKINQKMKITPKFFENSFLLQEKDQDVYDKKN